jgi:hypothetical protein
MRFLKKFSRLFQDLSVYQEVIDQKLKTCISFFALFYLIFSLIAGLYLHNRFTSKFVKTSIDVAAQVKSSIPQNAKFVIKNGQLTVSELQIPLSIQSFLYIDPTASVSALATSSALVSLGNTDARVATADLSETQIINYLRDGIEGAMTGSTIHSTIDQIVENINTFKPFTPIIIAIVLFIGLFIARFIYVAIYSAMFVLGSLLFGNKLPYTSFIKLTLHTIIVADTLNTAIVLLYGQSYPMVFSLTFFGVTLFAHNSNRVNSPN